MANEFTREELRALRNAGCTETEIRHLYFVARGLFQNPALVSIVKKLLKKLGAA